MGNIDQRLGAVSSWGGVAERIPPLLLLLADPLDASSNTEEIGSSIDCLVFPPR